MGPGNAKAPDVLRIDSGQRREALLIIGAAISQPFGAATGRRDAICVDGGEGCFRRLFGHFGLLFRGTAREQRQCAPRHDE